MRRVLLGCDTCNKVTPHVEAYRVVGKTEGARVDGHFKLVQPQEVEPTRPHKANAVECLWMCVDCEALRRWGLEVVDAEGLARESGVHAGGEGGEGDGEELGAEPLVPEESVEAKAVRVGKRTQVGRA